MEILTACLMVFGLAIIAALVATVIIAVLEEVC